MSKKHTTALERVARAIENAAARAQSDDAARAGRDRRRAELDEKRRGLDETRRLAYIAKVRLARDEQPSAELVASLVNSLTHHHPELELSLSIDDELWSTEDFDSKIATLSSAVDETNRLYQQVGVPNLLYTNTLRWPAESWNWSHQ